jgi:hypothetical protein
MSSFSGSDHVTCLSRGLPLHSHVDVKTNRFVTYLDACTSAMLKFRGMFLEHRIPVPGSRYRGLALCHFMRLGFSRLGSSDDRFCLPFQVLNRSAVDLQGVCVLGIRTCWCKTRGRRANRIGVPHVKMGDLCSRGPVLRGHESAQPRERVRER